MRRLLIAAALSAATFSIGHPLMAQTTATSEGQETQADMEPMTLLTSMFLDIDASASAGEPVERASNVYGVGERIAIYTKFSNVGRVNPGAVDGFMDLAVDIRVVDASGTLIVDQAVPRPERESVTYPYEGAVPDAYFDSFKLTIFALPVVGDYDIMLTFTDMTRPANETQPVVVEHSALID